MKLKSYKNLIRLLLLLISTQFASPYLNSVSDDLVNYTVQASHHQSVGLSIIFEETRNERESEDDRALSSRVLVDFGSLLRQLNLNFTPVVSFLSPELRYNLQPPLFTMNHSFII